MEKCGSNVADWSKNPYLEVYLFQYLHLSQDHIRTRDRRRF